MFESKENVRIFSNSDSYSVVDKPVSISAALPGS